MTEMYKRIVTQSRMSTFPRLGNRSKMPIPVAPQLAERCRFFVQEEVNTDLSFVVVSSRLVDRGRGTRTR